MAFIRLHNVSDLPGQPSLAEKDADARIAARKSRARPHGSHQRTRIERHFSRVPRRRSGGPDRLQRRGQDDAAQSTCGNLCPHARTDLREGQGSSLFAVNVGVNPEATGRENIILRGMYMDVHPREMRPRMEEIAAFTELGPYLDMPVRTYSAGMSVRLAFTASTCIPPDILLMDEWISAGDARFLEKAHKRMADLIGSSNIMVLASHSMPLLREWCNRGILLQQGRIVVDGTVDEAIAAYERSSATEQAVPQLA